MANLFDMMFQAHTKMGTIRIDTSTAISSVEINSQTYSSAHSDDQFNNGSLFLIAGSTLTDGQVRRISDYDASSGQFTFSSNVTSGGSTATTFGYTTPEFPHELVVELANMSLQSIGPFTYTNRDLGTSANQTVYSFGSTIYHKNFHQVDIMGRVGSSTDNPEWDTVYNWNVIPSTRGGQNLLVFDQQPPINRDIQIWFSQQHGRVQMSTSGIDERIHPELAALVLTEKMYEYRNSQNRGSVEFDLQRWNDAKRQVQEAKVRWPVYSPKSKPKLFVAGDGEARGGDRLPWAPPYGPS